MKNFALSLYILSLLGLPTLSMAQDFNTSPAENEDAPIEISADGALEWHRQDKQYIARGNAMATQQDKTIKADILTANYESSEENDTQITNIIAEGNVIITTATDTAYGDRGDYDVTKEIVTLTGDVKVLRDKNVLNGKKAVVNLKTGVSKMLGDSNGGRVTGTFYPSSSE